MCFVLCRRARPNGGCQRGRWELLASWRGAGSGTGQALSLPRRVPWLRKAAQFTVQQGNRIISQKTPLTFPCSGCKFTFTHNAPWISAGERDVEDEGLQWSSYVSTDHRAVYGRPQTGAVEATGNHNDWQVQTAMGWTRYLSLSFFFSLSLILILTKIQ